MWDRELSVGSIFAEIVLSCFGVDWPQVVIDLYAAPAGGVCVVVIIQCIIN